MADARPQPAAGPASAADHGRAGRGRRRAGRPPDRDELDRLALAEPAPIAFLATLRRFVDARAGRRPRRGRDGGPSPPCRPAARRRPAIRDAIVGRVAELILGDDPRRAARRSGGERARERLTRGWDAAVGQPRYGPATRGRRRDLLERFAGLDADERRWLAATGARERLGDGALAAGHVARRGRGPARLDRAAPRRDAAAAIGRPGGPDCGRPAGRGPDRPPARPAPRLPGHAPSSARRAVAGHVHRRRSRDPRARVRARAPERRYAMLAAVDPRVVDRRSRVVASSSRLAVLGRRSLRVAAGTAARREGAETPAARPAAAATRLRHEASASAQAADRAPSRDATDCLEVGRAGRPRRRRRSARITSANPRPHELLGRAAGSLVGRTVMEAFLDPTVEDAVRARPRQRVGGGRDPPRRRRRPALVVRARRAPDGGAWLVLDDVSELRRLQRIRTEFIDNLSHELRTPLTTVSLLAETLAREADAADAAVPPRMRERIAKIEVETGHLVQMVNELLDLSRIESGGTLAARRRASTSGRSPSTPTERLRLFAERQGVTSGSTVEPDLPPVRGDAARLGQVVVNLVHNAVKFSPDGGDVTVGVATRRATTVVVAVEDHGVGIPRAAQDRVFERFYKVDRARLSGRRSGGGTGLGLAIARHVIEQHGGRIWVESEEGVGSTFRFALPIAGRRPPDAQRRPEDADGPPARRDAEHPEPGRPLAGAAGLIYWPTWPRSSPTCSGSRRSSTSSSRTGSSGRRGRAATRRTGRGPAGPSTATACSSARPPGGDRRRARSTSGYGRSGAARRRGPARRRHASSSS